MNSSAAAPAIRTISVIGGTGSLGSGLARRWARAGYRVILGSRDAERARQMAATLLPGTQVEGMDNAAAAEAADIAVLTVPFSHQQPILALIGPALRGKILVDATVPLVPPKVARVQLPEEGSAAQRAEGLLDDVTVVSAFQNVAADLLASDAELDCDVLVAGDRVEARETVVQLARQAGLRAWHAGPLQNAAAAEALTSVLIFMNRHYGGGHAGLRITGLTPAD